MQSTTKRWITQLSDLRAADEYLEWPNWPDDLRPSPPPKPSKPHDYQREAMKDVVKGFKNADRGQLIMACGTGKTLTSLFRVPAFDLVIADEAHRCAGPVSSDFATVLDPVARLPQINTQACRKPYSLLDMASLSDLLGRCDADPRRRGRPRRLTPDKLALAERMRASGEPVPVIVQTLRVSTPTMYRLLAERTKRAGS